MIKKMHSLDVYSDTESIGIGMMIIQHSKMYYFQ